MLLTARHRSGRTFFLLYVCSVWIAVLSALPVMNAAFHLSRAMHPASEWPGVSPQVPSARSPQRTFDELDRNGDGRLDKSEVAPVPGLSANFERADRNENGVLDATEFREALGWLGSAR
jgi:EF hand